MDYKYIHNSQEKQVFRMPSVPNVDRAEKSGKLIGWDVRMEIDVTRADNILNGSQWKYPIKNFPKQHFDNRYTEQQVISHFLNRNTPAGIEIKKEEYIAIKEAYEIDAKSNHA
jgi:hypothetical protein